MVHKHCGKNAASKIHQWSYFSCQNVLSPSVNLFAGTFEPFSCDFTIYTWPIMWPLISVQYLRFRSLTVVCWSLISSTNVMSTDNVIIINKLLRFYFNGLNVLHRSILNCIVLDNFNYHDITNDKDVLYTHISITLKHRCIKRQVVYKGNHNIDNISKVLEDVGPNSIPIFVVSDFIWFTSLSKQSSFSLNNSSTHPYSPHWDIERQVASPNTHFNGYVLCRHLCKFTRNKMVDIQ